MNQSPPDHLSYVPVTEPAMPASVCGQSSSAIRPISTWKHSSLCNKSFLEEC